MGVGAIKAFLTSFYVLPYFAFLSASLKESSFLLREAAKKEKILLLMDGPLRGGGGVKGRAIKEKRIFFGTFFSNVSKFLRLLSSRGEGG